ncbi:hypothetical protein Goshw_020187 [Gossypium schwendimanii]|uniref:Uncharacterized protein n=1 Tax=Gossypium schwendimanii TaxID=34291 RepID=A0A7J9N7K8_GOSSC|nr:hypothetical protein [Gossypium schwendimanii]
MEKNFLIKWKIMRSISLALV